MSTISLGRLEHDLPVKPGDLFRVVQVNQQGEPIWLEQVEQAPPDLGVSVSEPVGVRGDLR